MEDVKYPATCLQALENSRFYITTGAAKMLHDLDNRYWEIGEWSMVKQQRALLRLAKKQKTYGTKLSLEDLKTIRYVATYLG